MVETNSPVPGRPHTIDLSTLFVLFYRHGTNPNCTKQFQSLDLVTANARGRQHCELMGFAFQYVKPFLSDLEVDERRKLRAFGQPQETILA